MERVTLVAKTAFSDPKIGTIKKDAQFQAPKNRADELIKADLAAAYVEPKPSKTAAARRADAEAQAGK
jgi:hypothetical protein